MSSDTVLEQSTSPRIRRPSQILRKPVGNHHASLEVVHVAHPHRTNFLDTDGMSPVSPLSSLFRSPIDRVTSSYFSPDSIRFSRNVSNISTDLGTSPLPFVDLNVHGADMRMGHNHTVIDHSNQGSSVRPESDISALREASLYNGYNIGAHAYPLFGIRPDEAAFVVSSGLTSQAGSLTRGLEQSIIEASQEHGTNHTGVGQIIGETRWEQKTNQAGQEQPGLGYPRRQVGSGQVSKWLSISLRWWFMSLLFLVSLGIGLAALLLTLHSQNH